MILDLFDLNISIIRKFDGIYNYFNPSHYNGRTIFRRESKFENKVLVSDVIDQNDTIILKHYIDDDFLWSYEDARFINDNEISICCCKRDRNDLSKFINAEFKKYNLLHNKFTNYTIQNTNLEKNWQFYNDKIIYHINPYTVLNYDETFILKDNINWNNWIEKYGNRLGLSTNVFKVNNENYMLFHSSKYTVDYIKYFIGILKLRDDLTVIGYIDTPLFESNVRYTKDGLLNKMWEWRKTELCTVWKYEVIFPMNVIVDDNINIYSGLNDCSAVNIIVNKDIFANIIKKYECIK